MADRYQKLFSGASERGEGVFIPFCVLGDPDIETSFDLIKGMVKAGADALELGLPFSDPVADGPLIQKAGLRALEAGVKVSDCFEVIARVRQTNSKIPIGLLVYANLIEARGVETFFKDAGMAGVDSVLIADVPVAEIDPYTEAAGKQGVKIVLVLPQDADEKTFENVAVRSKGYLYLLSRRGVTGVETRAGLPSRVLMDKLKAFGSAPAVLGFGISSPEQVGAAMSAGCAGAISGSAVVKIIEEIGKGSATPKDLHQFIATMKAATL
jgi:tryptophan synthase alpha chain